MASAAGRESVSSGVPVGPSLPSSAVRFRRIEVDGGRINFKNGDEKLPLAFVGVKGTVETDRPGRWIMNLDATPWRAAVVVQQAGTIHLSGDLGGTSSAASPRGARYFLDRRFDLGRAPARRRQ